MDSILIPKYCINYKDAQRKEWSKAQFVKHNIDVRFVDGVNPETDLYLLEELGVTIETPISTGALGSFLAHRKTWKECLNNPYSWIFEDDVYIKENWKEVNKHLHLLNTEAPTVIKLCAFNRRGGNDTPSQNDVKMAEGLYKCPTALSNLSYVFNKAFVNKLWQECHTVTGITLDYEMQKIIKNSYCYAFYPNLMVQAQECPSIRNRVIEPQLGGRSIGHDLYADICKALPKDSVVCELGSGNGTHWLSKKFKVISIEQNKDFINKYDSTYYHSPINNGWYDRKLLPNKILCDVLLVDAPTGITRGGIIDNFDLFEAKIVIFDDVNRPKDMEIALRFCAKHNFKYEIKGTDKQYMICKQ